MTSGLCSLLVTDGVLAIRQVEQALLRQAVYGGALDTVLLEMRLLDEARLLGLLSRTLGLPAGTPDMVDSQDQAAARMVPRGLAQEHGVVPARVDGPCLIVLVSAAIDVAALEQLAFLLGVELRPFVVLECRLHQALELRYAIPMPARFARLCANLGSSPATFLATPPSPVRLPLAATTAATADAAATTTVVEASAAARPARPTAAMTVAMPPQAQPRKLPVAALSLAAAMQRIAEAVDRESVFEALARGVLCRLDFVALFTVHSGQAVARLIGRPDSVEPAESARAAVALDRASALRTVHDSSAPYLGPLLESEDLALLSSLGRAEVPTALVLPVVLRGRTVCLVYGDRSPLPVEGDDLESLLPLLATAAQAFSRLILAGKQPRRGKDVTASGGTDDQATPHPREPGDD